jgi:hypothetical protein
MMRLQWGQSMHVRDIPILGDLIDTGIVYAATSVGIVRHPFAFVHGIAFDDPVALKRAFKFIGAAIALAYLIMTPALVRHGFDVGELQFGVLVLMRLALITVLYHAAFLVVGYRQPLAKSLILSSYLNGVYLPLHTAALLPAYLLFGPHAFFKPLSDGVTPAESSILELVVVLLGFLLVFVAYPLCLAVASYWWAKAYNARVWLSAVLLLATLVLAGLGNFYVLPWVTQLFL